MTRDTMVADRPTALTGRFLDGFQRIAGGVFVCGEVLLDAKEELEHGEWSAWVDDTLPISLRTAQIFMRIATDRNLLRYRDREVVCLPPSWTTLHDLTGMEEGQFDALVDAGQIHPEMTRADVKAALAEQLHEEPAPPLAKLPEGKYRAILADPPWGFETRGAAGNGKSAERHYPTMSLQEIELLPVMNLAADDSTLFLWVTSDVLVHAPRLMYQWGFSLRTTAFVWVKEGGFGQGYWTRKGSEICLLGTRGKPQRLNSDVAEVIHAPRGRHSEKPSEVYERIERLVAGPYIELFARDTRTGWDVWGNDPEVASV